MMWIQRPSPHSNSEARMLSLGIPMRRKSDGVSARDQCIIIGISAPWARLVCAGPATPVRSRETSRLMMPMTASQADGQVPSGNRT